MAVFVRDENSRAETKYVYTPTDLVRSTKMDLSKNEFIFEANIPETEFTALQKAARVMSLPSVEIVSKSGSVAVVARDTKNPTGNQYSLDLGTSEKDFCIRMTTANFKFIAGGYTIRLVKPSIIRFDHASLNLTYLVAGSWDSESGDE